ncbi:unnamed protein product [Vicia faba]|uniref:Uncharacterized protein n=1 Tax=Vicia faba TaxID=3906 RepID=A0AAV0YZE4_VICFA|nr:unnamed protein product [Vicia faba]
MYNRMVNDSDVVKVYQYDMETKSIMHIYVEHKGNVQEDGVDGVQEGEVGNVQQDDADDVQQDNVGDVQEDEVGDVHTDDADENEDNGSGEDIYFEVDGLSFDDSEDERAIGLDDCFEDQDRSSGVKVVAMKDKLTPKKVPYKFI